VKKIVIIHQSAELYGSDKMLLLMLKHLDKSLFFPVVIIPTNGPLKDALENLLIEVHIAPVLKVYRAIFKPKNGILFLKDFKSGMLFLENLHKKHHFDMVYSNTLAVLLGMFFARKHKVKHLWHVHEIINHPKTIAQLYPKLLNANADAIVCNSKATLQNLSLRLSKLNPKLHLIYNGVETQNNLSLKSEKEDFGFNSSDVVVTLVGRISRLKGHQWVLNTIVSELNEAENLKFLFVGSPVVGQEFYLENIQQFIIENHLQNKVKIIPFTNEIANIWRVTDIALMPSTEAESFGLVAAEAMLAQKPVIGSDLGGLSEIIVPHQTGFLVQPFNEIQLKNTILKLYENPNLRQEFGKAGRRQIIKNFNIENHVLLIEHLINQL